MEILLLFTKRFCKILLFSSICFTVKAQHSLDYRQVFPEKYSEAIEFLQKNKWINDSLTSVGLDANLAVAVVFPEILRYSAIQNWAETKSLEVLYSQYGEKYSDFSVGRFQMKPSFAYSLEKEWNKAFTSAQHQRFGITAFDTADIQTNRYQRVTKLNDLKWGVKYLAIFMLIMDKKYAQTHWKSKEEKLRFYATAYNAGFQKSKNEIEKASQRKDFHTSILKPKLCYNYAEVALFFYKER